MKWTVHGERSLYDSEWVRLTLVDVEIPGEDRFEHHVIRMPQAAAGTVVHDPDRGVLLIYRHRFISDVWGWEIPAGRIDPGESAEDAAGREVLEETGWKPDPVRHLITYRPTIGLSDLQFHLFVSGGATRLGEPSDPSESERVEWVPIPELRELIPSGQITDGLALTALLYFLAFETGT